MANTMPKNYFPLTQTWRKRMKSAWWTILALLEFLASAIPAARKAIKMRISMALDQHGPLIGMLMCLGSAVFVVAGWTILAIWIFVR